MASFGALALASAAVGLQPDPETAVSQLSKVEDRYVADPVATERYQKIFSLYSDLYENNEAMFARLEELRQD